MTSTYPINKRESQAINLFKFFLTILVVFLHSYNDQLDLSLSDDIIHFETLQYIISQIICRCAVPSFFFISGLLLYRKEFCWQENIIKKLHSLLIPYFIFNTFWIIFYALVQKVPFLSVFFSQPENVVTNWTFFDWVDKYIGFSGYPIVYPLWFIRDLFVLNIFATVIKKLVDRFPRIIFTVLILILIFNIKTNLFFFQEKNTIFFIWGYYAVKYKFKFEKLGQLRLSFLFPLCILTVLVDFITKDLSLHYLFRNASNIFCALLLIRLSFLIIDCNKFKFFTTLGKYSFFIYCFHEMNLRIFKKIVTAIMPRNVLSYTFQYFSIAIIITTCCIILAMILEKYFPTIYKFIMGARN